LGAFGQINPKVLDTVLISAAVGDFSGVDGQRILGTTWIPARFLAVFRHGDTSLTWFPISYDAYRTVYAHLAGKCGEGYEFMICS
jgi:hypothetical protein